MALFRRTSSAVIALSPVWERLVAAGVADPADDVFAAEFLQIIRGVAGAVLAWALFTECAHAGGDIRGGETVG